jgi:hypothetical protein
MRKLGEKQAEFLSDATDILDKRASEPSYQHWLTGEGQDESYSYCRGCVVPEIGPRPESWMRGIGLEDSDGVALCECCGALLEYVLTDYGVMEELFHFEECPDSFDWNNADQCYELARIAHGIYENPDQERILIRVLLKGKNFPKELQRIRVKPVPLVLNMKIGTIPFGPMQIKYKRTRPAVGSRVLVRQVGPEYKWSEWQSVIIDKYNDDGFCFASRM